MALRGRSERGSTMIWPGFVDAMTALLLVLMFVLSIFMIVQFVLREELTGKDRTLAALTSQLGALTDQLSLAENRASGFEAEIRSLNQLLEVERTRTEELVAALEQQTLEGERLSSELATRVAELSALTGALEQRDLRVGELEAILGALQQERAAEQAELADLRGREQAIEEVESENERLASQVAEIRERLAAAEGQARDTELTLQERIAALELALDQKRQEAEDTLLLLAAAEAREQELSAEAIARAEAMTRQEQAAAFARAALEGQTEVAENGRRAIALLNFQVDVLRGQLATLEAALEAAEARDAENQVVIENLGARLNQALAAQVSELQRYRSEFFGRLREILGGRRGVQIVGDRFVFQSEVLFESGSADLGAPGRRELSNFASILRDLSREIPSDVNWILRVDGHTDVVPIINSENFRNNWELSQARALSVVEFLIDEQGIDADRLAATGFGEYQPLDPGRTTEALARNRRIELKLTER